MPNQWNATLATQNVAFRGTSQVSIKTSFTAFPDVRSITQARYAVNVTGGVSGSFGVLVLGHVGGFTVHLAGNTAISAIGTYVLYPIGYTGGGAQPGVIMSTISTPPLSDVLTLVDVVPPSLVHFQSGVATAGISAACTVVGCLHAD